ncbi:MAG: hypothetical protein LBR05_10280 [Azoarcus sp.]|nr:hypothetical protein [Azoarcus sp.]
MRVWTYRELTTQAESDIGRFMKQAAMTSGDQAAVYKCWAYGAYIMWTHLTGERREDDEDDMRLKRLMGLVFLAEKEEEESYETC